MLMIICQRIAKVLIDIWMVTDGMEVYMKIKIALLGYKGFTERAEKYTQYLKNVEISIFSSFGYESLSLVQKLQDEGIDAIVTGQTNYMQVKDKVKIKPILFGGGQQKGMRSGTENVPAIAGLR